MNGSSNRSNADVYEQCFVPALFHAWGPVVAGAAGVGPGQRILDVACGTGTLARAASEIAGQTGSVAGLDPNEEMLEVARREAPGIDWVPGRAERLPFPDGRFDAVVSQFGLMFFDDPTVALREMVRVLKPDGRLAVAVCDGLDHSPGYAVLTELLYRLFGESVAAHFRAPFRYGDRDLLRSCFNEAGIAADIQRHDGMVRFTSIESLVTTERACAWTLGGILGDEQFERLAQAAEESLRPFVGDSGDVAFTMPALIATATKAEGVER